MVKLMVKLPFHIFFFFLNLLPHFNYDAPHYIYDNPHYEI